jgi:hypothetical protein
MKNVFAVLREREMDLVRVRGEVEALRFVIPLLAEEEASASAMNDVSTISSRYSNKWPLDVRASTP